MPASFWLQHSFMPAHYCRARMPALGCRLQLITGAQRFADLRHADQKLAGGQVVYQAQILSLLPCAIQKHYCRHPLDRELLQETIMIGLSPSREVDLDHDKEEDEMTEEEKALLKEWGIHDPITEDELSEIR